MATGAQKDIEDSVFPAVDVAYASVDFNTTGATELYNATDEAEIRGAYLDNGGSTAVVTLEVTDGTNVSVLTPGQTAGDGIAYGDRLGVSADDTVQANVTTIEGSALTETASLSRGEKRT